MFINIIKHYSVQIMAKSRLERKVAFKYHVILQLGNNRVML